MSHRVLVILIAGLLVLGAGGALIYFSQRAGEPDSTIEPAPPSATAAPAAPAPLRSPAITKPIVATPTPDPAAVEPPAPTRGTLILESDVPETSVFIDRVYKGIAPVTVEDLTPGPHRLNMSVTGYEGVSETIEVKAGTHTISMKFKEIRLDATLAVLHRHAIGSCAGTLRATPQGLTYDTDHAPDRFRVALTDIETFEFAYLEKNLRVKIRGGKTYNFTDPGGLPDPLYQFYQPVEKVRQRLLTGRRPSGRRPIAIPARLPAPS